MGDCGQRAVKGSDKKVGKTDRLLTAWEPAGSNQ